MKTLGVLFLVGLTWVGITVAVIRHAMNEMYIDQITDRLPNIFPVLVMAEGEPQIVWGEQLEAFKSNHPDYSFLVPRDRQEEILRTLKQRTRGHQRSENAELDTVLPWSASFEVAQLAEGKQSFQVKASLDDDDVNIGWYEASKKELNPRAHQSYFGPGVIMMGGITAMFATALLWGGAFAILGLWRWIRRSGSRGKTRRAPSS